ncbi:unnamed protein product [marine sediment metagenome]|uniref:Uncharacterized protein n=1 Tax=marine sediment metagenome TaxID=412755 RepID=X1JWT1_9ZZZZ
MAPPAQQAPPAEPAAEPGALGQLDLYEKLFKNTPEFDDYKLWTIKKVLLTSIVDLNMVELASEKGVRYEVFTEAQVNKTRLGLKQPLV